MLNPFTEMESIWTTQNGKNKFEMSSAQYLYLLFHVGNVLLFPLFSRLSCEEEEEDVF